MNNSSGFGMEMRSGELNLPSEQQLQNCFFNPTWESSVDHNDPFESALSSIVSSPVASNAGAGGEGVMLRELIGRLGSICNSGEISPESYIGGAHNSTNTSCYTTPLNSPPKHMRTHLAGAQFPSAPFSADPGFAERAARYSCFTGSRSFSGNIVGPQAPNVPELPAKASSPELGDSREGSSVSDQIPGGMKAQNDGNGRKRKSKAAGKDTKVGSENEESKAKKSKQEDKTKEEDPKQPEPPKDYIHVRARRGQATDSHSLAERVRREKISERMKFLQDLVPGCNKVTGKAVMLDEIINYVQSLQRQVEFLSMKLSTVNPRMDFNMEALLSKEMLQSRDMYPMDSSIPYGYQPQQVHYISNGTAMPLPSMDGFGEVAAPPQALGFWQDDLQSFVQMGFVPNQAPSFHGSVAADQMKVEP